ncbi:YkyB family protein [Fervidibacillus halotolerans]|uniref:YkyB family protein n=1 Tax=Fervidibacillus halotolerans TaxID=2980027 RepID=A0A9E8M0H9_9BACI|nr:YkyB family protein [Fervidibacillus halotolerans]WAA13223.1 YkyB family protein [Fervidibacillus halotolerans]
MQSTQDDEQTFPVDLLSKALFIVNRHAKTAPDSKYLYQLKHAAIKKMLSEGKAKKIGLHFSRNPRFSQQQLDVLISCGNYYFHIPPTKDDIQQLKNLGKLDDSVRNPKTILSLKEAKRILERYTGLKKREKTKSFHRRYTKPVFKRLGE